MQVRSAARLNGRWWLLLLMQMAAVATAADADGEAARVSQANSLAPNACVQCRHLMKRNLRRQQEACDFTDKPAGCMEAFLTARKQCKQIYKNELCEGKMKNATLPEMSSYDPCSTGDACHQDALCEPLSSTTFTCRCKLGFSGNGYSCVSINPCNISNLNTCDENAVCNHTGPATHRCQCKANYENSGRVCNAVKLCATENGGCNENAKCAQTAPGEIACACNTGYKGDGASCEQENKCSFKHTCAENAACHALSNADKTYTCSCKQGFSGDGSRSCQAIDACNTPSACDPQANCTSTGPATKSCSCNTGFKGDGSSCHTYDPCSKGWGGCDSNSLCLSTWGSDSNQCVCNTGFKGVGRFCEPINVCKLKNRTAQSCSKNAMCTYNGPGQRSCKCNRFYTGDGVICNAINYCGANVTMPVIHRSIDQMPCHMDAECSLMAGGLKCTCNTGYSGDGRVCLWAGDAGDRCPTNICGPNADCFFQASGHKACACRSGFRGADPTVSGCESIDRCAESSHNCDVNAACNTTGPGTFHCTCKTNYQGAGMRGGEQCKPLNPCDVNNGDCSLDAVCKFAGPGLRQCQCKPNFEGSGEICTPMDGCTISNGGCHDDAQCKMTGPSSTKCECNKFFVGNGVDCQPEKFCPIVGYCSRFATCAEQQGANATCTCNNGYHGDGVSCAETDACQLMRIKKYTGAGGCHDDATCLQTGPTSHRCTCKSGFTGDGASCASANPCTNGARGHCDLNAVCTHTGPGLRTCQCKHGYVGDGNVNGCSKVDHCAGATKGGCHANAICTSLLSGPSCQCFPGFTGDGSASCVNTNPCPASTTGESHCHPDAICTADAALALTSDPAAAIKCTCKQGYKGDGQKTGTCVPVNNCTENAAVCAQVACPTGTESCLADAAKRFVCTSTGPGKHSCKCADKYHKNAEGNCMPVDNCVAELHNCDVHAKCTATGAASHKCACHAGYSGNGAVCTLLNNCKSGSAVHGCDKDASCVFTGPAKSNCSCNAGFKGSGKSCAEIDRCADGTDKCSRNSACVSTGPNQYRCSCNVGYKTAGAYGCVQLDHCLHNNGGCDVNAKCKKAGFTGSDKPGASTAAKQHSCQCNAGYSGTGKAGSCAEIDNCAVSANSTNNGGGCQANVSVCVKTGPGQSKCECLDNFVKFGTGCKMKNLCTYDPQGFPNGGCPANAVCTPELGKVSCNCRKGFNSKGGKCVSDSPCSADENDCHPRLASCTSITPKPWATHNCTCVVGYEGNGKDKCSEIDICKDGSNGGCDKAWANCYKNGPGTAKCMCKAKYEGTGFQGDCRPVNNCHKVTFFDRPCHEHATCQFTGPATNNCTCNTGFQGDGLTCSPIDNCKSDHGGCDGNATCLYTGPGQSKCKCKQHFTGSGLLAFCSEIKNCELDHGGCNKYAKCTHTGVSKNNCTCNAGYSGSGWGVECNAINNCKLGQASHTCSRNALCTMNGPASNLCACNAHYTGDGTTCVEVLVCTVGYGGCDPNSLCNKTGVGKASCACNAGYKGSGKLAECKAINPCLTNKGGCHLTHGVCTYVSPGIATCSCLPAYSGTGNGTQSCKAINHCNTSSYGGCDKVNGKCTMTGPAKNACTCKKGYSSSGENNTGASGCQIIRNCAKDNGGCHVHADCTNTGPAEHTCKCKAGFAGNNVNLTNNLLDCRAVMPCEVNNGGCDTMASCTNPANRSGTPSCTCNKGHEGSGQSCQASIYQMTFSLTLGEDSTWSEEESEYMSPWGQSGSIQEAQAAMKTAAASDIALSLSVPATQVSAKAVKGTGSVWLITGIVTGSEAVTLAKSHVSSGTQRRLLSLASLLWPSFSAYTGSAVTQNGGPIAAVFPSDAMPSHSAAFACNSGFKATLSEGVLAGCIAINNCEAPASACGANALCTSTGPGTNVCTCQTGFESQDGGACKELNMCLKASYGGCNEFSTCTSTGAGTNQCECNFGYKGDGASCTAHNKCAAPAGDNTAVCGEHSSCHYQGPATFSCDCDVGYAQADDGTCKSINPCEASSAACHTDTICKHVGPNLKECTPKFGYVCDGGRLACKPIDPCKANNGGCHAFANCTYLGPGNSSCDCKKGYKNSGEYIGEEVAVENFLEIAPAASDGEVPGATKPKVEAGKSCELINLCLLSNGGCAPQGGVCTMQGPNNAKCSCKANYEGNGKTCTKINKCLKNHGSCHANAVCKPPDANCACNAGFKGDGKTCFEGHACPPGTSTCTTPHSFCSNTGTDPTQNLCKCQSGFAGDKVESPSVCTAINPCQGAHSCHHSALCSFTAPGQHTCKCQTGFQGDGHMCASINPCLVLNGGCGHNSVCTHVGPDTRECKCMEGFEGNAYNWHCKSINPCKTDHGGCDKVHAECTHIMPNVKQCKCQTKGYRSVEKCPPNNFQFIRAFEWKHTSQPITKTDQAGLVAPEGSFLQLEQKGDYDIGTLNPSNSTHTNGVSHGRTVAVPWNFQAMGAYDNPIAAGKHDLQNFAAKLTPRSQCFSSQFSKAAASCCWDKPGLEPADHSVDGLTRDCTQRDVTFNQAEAHCAAQTKNGSPGRLCTKQEVLASKNAGKGCGWDGVVYSWTSDMCIELKAPSTGSAGEQAGSAAIAEKPKIGPLFFDKDCPGNNLDKINIGHNPATYCAVICEEYKDSFGRKCRAFSFKNKTCYLKAGCPKLQFSSGTVSALSNTMVNTQPIFANCAKECIPIDRCADHGKVSGLGDGSIVDHSCSAGASKCTYTGPNTNNCSCNAGYKGDGKAAGTKCTEINRCKDEKTTNAGCYIHATCTHTGLNASLPASTRSCDCNEHYVGTGLVCAEIDYCSIGHGGCSNNAGCTKKFGGNDCKCNLGWTGSGKSCAPIDNCETANGGCDVKDKALCTYTGPGENTCACKYGFTGSGVACSEIICGKGKIMVNGLTCANCSANEYNDVEKSTACKTCVNSISQVGSKAKSDCKCNPGRYGTGENNCPRCELDTYSTTYGIAQCTTCPANAGNLAKGASTLESCSCKTGWEGSRSACTSINNCESAELSDCAIAPSGQCSHTGPGQHKCSCMPGYTGDGKTCLEVFPCHDGKHGGCDTNAACAHESPGQRKCTCKPGYDGTGIISGGASYTTSLLQLSAGSAGKPNATNAGCTPINMCKLASHGCHEFATCKSISPGARSCTCNKDYTGNGTHCTYMMPCASADRNKCHAQSNCMFTTKKVATLPAPAVARKLPAGAASYATSATLVNGLTASTLMYADRDSYTVPARLASLAAKDRTNVYLLKDVHQTGTMSGTVFASLTLTSPATVYVCVPGGDVAGFSHTDAGKQPNVVDPSKGWSLVTAGKWSGMTLPMGVPCGMWRKSFDAGTHDLHRTVSLGWTYTYMVHMNPSMDYSCTCHSGWQGTGLACSEINHCTAGTHGCANDARCSFTGPATNNCTCNDGYKGSGTACVEINLCEDLASTNGGCPASSTCTKTGPAKRSCTCFDNFNPTIETTQMHADYGRHELMKCTAVDNCATGAHGCSNNAFCTHTGPADNTCTCNGGYKGFGTVSSPCTQLNPCTDAGVQSGCDTQSTCTHTGPGLNTCACNSGWIGSGMFCAEINNCIADVSTVGSTSHQGGCNTTSSLCVKTGPGTNVCNCKMHFERRAGASVTNGKCVAIDYCKKTVNGGCHAQATCKKTFGGVTCPCNIGYSGDGTTCAQIKPCDATDPVCHEHSVCSHLGPGQHACTCKSGFQTTEGTANGHADVKCAAINKCTDVAVTHDCPTALSNGGCVYEGPGLFSCYADAGFESINGWLEPVLTATAAVNNCEINKGGCTTYADCTYTAPGASTCSCKTGYKLKAADAASFLQTVAQGTISVGAECEPINRCVDEASSNAGCAADVSSQCSYTGPGQRDCTCRPGYAGDGQVCTPINNCDSASTCNIKATCTYVSPGKHQCTCELGFSGNGVNCERVFRCPTGNGGCHTNANCADTDPGHRKCACKAGYRSAVQAIGAVNEIGICNPIDRCNDNDHVCGANAYCVYIGPDEYGCACKSGYHNTNRAGVKRDDKSACTAIDVCSADVRTALAGYPGVPEAYPCNANAKCTSTSAGQKSCTCNTGYTGTGSTAENGCVEIDDCIYTSRNKCHPFFATCTKTGAGEHSCACKEHYTGNGTHCAANNRCLNAPMPCSANAQCTPDLGTAAGGATGTYTCACTGGWKGDGRSSVVTASSTGCTSVDSCTAQEDTCGGLEGTVCLRSSIDAGAHGCVCRMGHERTECGAGYVCPCQSIDNCKKGPDVHGCNMFSTCIKTGHGENTCSCNFGYSGLDGACTVINKCTDGTADCQDHSTCQHDGPGVYSCPCDENYIKVDNKCVPINRCDMTDYAHGCSDDAECEYTGPDTNKCTCRVGYFGNGESCTWINACSHYATIAPTRVNGGCALNALCTDSTEMPNTRSCACNNGYEGDGQACFEIDNCADSDLSGCHDDAICTKTGPGTNTCLCKQGYSGSGQSCSVIDACVNSLDDCHATLGICTPTQPGNWNCACAANYRGNGQTCTAINLCSDESLTNAGCDMHHATCNYVGPNSRTCTCDAGYEGADGTSCIPIDHCAKGTDNCHDNAQCTYTAPGTFACACKTGYYDSVVSGVGGVTSCAEIDNCDAGIATLLGRTLNTCDSAFATCSKTGAGTHSCSCISAGYKLTTPANTTCQVHDPCTAGTHNCVKESGVECKFDPAISGAHTCECIAHYEWAPAPPWATGQTWSTTTCQPIDPCTSTQNPNRCEKNMDCTSNPSVTPNVRTCTCITNYEIDPPKNAHKGCMPIDPCTTREPGWAVFGGCHAANGVCTYESPGVHTCTCAEHYEGNGVTCSAIDYCTKNDPGPGCAANAVKVPKVGSCECSCPTHWNGDGFTCTQVDPCTDAEELHDCHSTLATCTHTGPGQHQCSCLDGYKGDGKECMRKNKCLDGTHTCTKYETCTDGGDASPGTFTCTCPPVGHANTQGTCGPNAVLSLWAPWGVCSHSCGSTGVRVKHRTFSWPDSDFQGAPHAGELSSSESCNRDVCCKVDGVYRVTDWSTWSTCSKSCGTGHQSRTRSVHWPVPGCKGDKPTGAEIETQDCNTALCACPAAVFEPWKPWELCPDVCASDHNAVRPSASFLEVSTTSSTSCSTNFGPVPGFYEGGRLYVAIQNGQHGSQASFPDLISAAACLTSRTSCQYTTGTYGLRLTGSQQNPGYQNNEQAHTCLNDLTGTTNFYQRTTNGYSYIFTTSESAMTSLNTALSAGQGVAQAVSYTLSSKHSSHHSGEGFSDHLWIYKDDSVLGGVCQAGDCLVGSSFYLSRSDGSDSSGPYSMSHTNPADGAWNSRALYFIASGDRFSAPSGAAYAIGDKLSFTAPTGAVAAHAPRENGFCVKSNGNDENAGVHKLAEGDHNSQAKQDECLARCAAHSGYTGCEVIWSQNNRGCYVHTSTAITHGNGVDRHYCWLKNPQGVTAAPPPTCNAGNRVLSGSCTPCSSGYFQGANSYGGSTCSPCVAGHTSNPGASSCTICPVNTFAPGGSSQCTPCSTGADFLVRSPAGSEHCTRFQNSNNRKQIGIKYGNNNDVVCGVDGNNGATAHAPRENGFCVKSNGGDENAGVYKLAEGDHNSQAKQDECLALCAAYNGYTGCEVIWSQSNRGCYVHTSTAITHGNGVDRHYCWLKADGPSTVAWSGSCTSATATRINGALGLETCSCVPTNPCLASNGGCGNMATCSFDFTSFTKTCSCDSAKGFTGTFPGCTATNICADSGLCPTNSDCSYRIESPVPSTGVLAECACQTGYTSNPAEIKGYLSSPPSSSGTCTAINYCDTSNGGCGTGATCTEGVHPKTGTCVCDSTPNSVGDFYVQSTTATTVGSRSVTGCTKVNLCDSDRNYCNTNRATCGVSSAAPFTQVCNCKANYEKVGSICKFTDVCAHGTHTCKNQASPRALDDDLCSSPSAGQFTCSCPEGYSGGDVANADTTCSEINRCNTNNGGCPAAANGGTDSNSCEKTGPGTFTCNCRPEFAKQIHGSGATTCNYQNPCTLGTHTCKNSDGNIDASRCTSASSGQFTCNCPATYKSNANNGCDPINHCVAGSGPSSGGASGAQYTISLTSAGPCPSGTSQVSTEAECHGAALTATMAAGLASGSGGVTCGTGANSYCPAGYAGGCIQHSVGNGIMWNGPVDGRPNPSRDHGRVCVTAAAGATHSCHASATCAYTGAGQYNCNCAPGYEHQTLADKSSTCIEVDKCAAHHQSTNGCLSAAQHATCTKTGAGTHECGCASHYFGDGRTSCAETNYCDTATCPANSTCASIFGGHTCSCRTDYHDKNVVLSSTNPSCFPDNPCLAGNNGGCDTSNAKCVYSGSGTKTNTCKCYLGWTSTNGGITCTRIVQSVERTRDIKYETGCSGTQTAPSGVTTESKQCNFDPCKCNAANDASWSGWSDAPAPAGTCSKTCGTGSKKQVRALVWPNAACNLKGKTPAGSAYRYVDCNTQCCAENAYLGQWSAWSACSKTCGGGTKTRTRGSVWPKPACKGNDIPAATVTSESSRCNDPCCSYTSSLAWSSYDTCNTRCGSGTQTKTQTATFNPAVGTAGYCGTPAAVSGNGDKYSRSCTVPNACVLTSTNTVKVGTKIAGTTKQPFVTQSCVWNYQTGSLTVVIDSGGDFPLNSERNAAVPLVTLSATHNSDQNWVKDNLLDAPSSPPGVCSSSTSTCSFGAPHSFRFENVAKLKAPASFTAVDGSAPTLQDNLPNVHAMFLDSVTGQVLGQFDLCKMSLYTTR